MLTFARRPRPAPRLAPVPSAVPVPAATMPVPFGPRAGQPVSATRLAAATPAPSTVVAQVVLGLIVVLAALLVVLAAHGL